MFSKLKQKSFPQWLILFILAESLAFAVLTELLHLPVAALLCVDAAWCILALWILKDWKALFQSSVQVKCLLTVAVLFFLSTLIGLALQYQSILYYIWGFRNNAGFFVLFFASILYFRAEDTDRCMKALDILFAINLAVSLYQFFVFGYKQDFLGGVFGVQGGCNAMTNVFMMIVITNSVVRYLNQKEKAWVCLLKCAAALCIASLAELKMFILEFGAIIVLAVLFSKFSRRKIYLLIGGWIGAILAIQLLTSIFPYCAGSFTLKQFWQTAASTAGYNGGGVEVNRLTAIPIAWNTYLTTWPQKLFGLGLGHCDHSSLSILTSPFYTEHGHILYTWFQSGFLMLETGLVGVVLYCGFFASVFFAAHSLERSGKGDTVYCQMAKILALLCFVLFVYDYSLRSYLGYLLYFSLSLPFLGRQKNQPK